MTEDEMAGWHHWLDGRESEWTPGVGDGQGGLACCNSWGHRESDTTEWLNWTDALSITIPSGLECNKLILKCILKGKAMRKKENTLGIFALSVTKTFYKVAGIKRQINWLLDKNRIGLHIHGALYR